MNSLFIFADLAAFLLSHCSQRKSQEQKREEGQFQCECGKTYLHQASLYNHKTYHCGKERQFACNYCTYRSSQKGTLKRHIYFKHPKHELNSSNCDIVDSLGSDASKVTLE